MSTYGRCQDAAHDFVAGYEHKPGANVVHRFYAEGYKALEDDLTERFYDWYIAGHGDGQRAAVRFSNESVPGALAELLRIAANVVDNAELETGGSHYLRFGPESVARLSRLRALLENGPDPSVLIPGEALEELADRLDAITEPPNRENIRYESEVVENCSVGGFVQGAEHAADLVRALLTEMRS